MKRFFIVLLILLSIVNFLFASIDSAIKEKSKNVDVSELIYFYEKLTAEEKPEQLKDWAFFALIRWLNVSKTRTSLILNDKIPLRYEYLKNTGLLEIENGRSGFISENDLAVLLPEEKKSDILALSRVLDKRLASSNKIPDRIHIFSYSFDPVQKKITINYFQTISGKTAFSPEYGYFEKEVKDITDFNEWISASDDIVGARWGGKYIVLYGRKYPKDISGKLSLNDVSGIYQAYFRDTSPEKEQQRLREYNVFISRKYDEVVRTNKSLRHQIQKGKITRKQILEEIRKRIPYTFADADANVGFSLDPQRDFNRLAEDMLKLARRDPSFNIPPDEQFVSLLSSYSASIESASRRIKTEQSLEPLLRIRRELKKSDDFRLKWLDDTLKNIELKNSYQSARYDGRIKGTEPAMVLFYTDLVAKLWALNYNNVAPVGKVAGFRAMPDIKVAKVYWDDFIKLSNTRLWFGLRQENFNVFGKKLLMSPVITRVYAASSDPLYPGKESKPNSQSADFLGWWDEHYEQVADYENYYHKLNQIQKWACLFMILNEEKNRALDFLLKVPVERSADFRTWYKNRQELKVKTDLPFIDETRYGKSNECLSIMSSVDYPLMNQYFFLSGGVSLASKKDILSKIKKGVSKAVQVKHAVSGVSKPQEESRIFRKTTWIIPIKENTVLRAPLFEVKPEKIKALVSDTTGIMKLSYDIGSENLGTLTASEENSEIKLRWREGIVDAANNLVEKLSERIKFEPGGDDFIKSIQNFENITVSEKGKSYFLKIKNSAKLLHLTINEEQRNKKYSYYVKGAAVSPDADIYAVGIISEKDAVR
ncbi:MAG: hypothetical protein AB1633_03330 [Elusimicrobiota bacterium]